MTRLNDIRFKMNDQGKIIPDSEFIMDVLSKLPDAKSKYGDPPYGMARALIEKDISDNTTVVTYLTVQQALTHRYQQLLGQWARKQQDKNEVALNVEATGVRELQHPGRAYSSGGRGRDGNRNQNGGRGRYSNRSGGRGRSPGRKGRGQRDMSKVKCYFCDKTGHVKADCFAWKNKQAQTATAATESSYSVSLTAAQVDDCRPEECYSYVPVDQDFGEPTRWSFSLYEEYEVETNEVENEDEPEEVVSFEESEDEPQMEDRSREDPLHQVLEDLMERVREGKMDQASNARLQRTHQEHWLLRMERTRKS